MAEPWVYPYTDFGEGRGKVPTPVLRAVIEVGPPPNGPNFFAIIDTGGPITVVAREVLESGGDPVDTGERVFLRLGGSTSASASNFAVEDTDFLVGLANSMQDWRWEHRWPKWPKWLANRIHREPPASYSRS